MTIYYLLPIVAIVLVVVLSKWGQKRAMQRVQNMSPEQARAKMNEFYAGSFELQPSESLFVTWIGEEYQGDASAARQVAGAALNQLANAAAGISTYVPMVQVALTTTGRLLIAREYSEMGERGHYKQIHAFAPGSQALDGSQARPGEVVKPPIANPMGRAAAPEFIRFRAPNGDFYEAWMHAGQTVEGTFVLAFRNMSAQLTEGATPAAVYA